MPIYEYECKFCSYRFQLLQKMNDAVPSVCPNCHKEGGIHKIISQTSFKLKGSGWYVTDYKNSGSSANSSKISSVSSNSAKEGGKR